MSKNDPAERAVRAIRGKTRTPYSAEEKIRIVVSGLRGEEGIAEGLYGSGSKNASQRASSGWLATLAARRRAT